MSGIPHYRGRFAPSPTGPLHFGSLVAALGSYLQARSSGGEWLVRIEDLDPPREIPGAADAILFTLDHLGLEWDGPVVYQSTRQHRYREALDRLDTLGVLYPCSCSRSEIAASGFPGTEGWIYPGTCRDRTAVGKHLALRTRTHNDSIAFIDTIQGEYGQRLETSVGDFVVRRADGLIAYQLAVVVDDAEQGITEVVRGSDLLNATPRQLYLQQLLGFSPPRYAHLPVATNDSGHKLSKQTGAQPMTEGAGNRYLLEALTFLGQAVSDDLRPATQAEILRWAVDHWDLDRVPRSSGLVWHPPEV